MTVNTEPKEPTTTREKYEQLVGAMLRDAVQGGTGDELFITLGHAVLAGFGAQDISDEAKVHVFSDITALLGGDIVLALQMAARAAQEQEQQDQTPEAVRPELLN